MQYRLKLAGVQVSPLSFRLMVVESAFLPTLCTRPRLLPAITQVDMHLALFELQFYPFHTPRSLDSQYLSVKFSVLHPIDSLTCPLSFRNTQEDKPFIKGIFPMRWGIYQDSGFRPDNDGPLVYFGGYADGLLLGMGGSSCHIDGTFGLTSTGSRSFTPALVSFLRHGVETGEAPPSPGWKDRREDLDEVFQAMAIANGYLTGLTGPVQHLEFVARVLCVGAARSTPSISETNLIVHFIVGYPPTSACHQA
jgi:hypothetical protein